jgi:YggT family protein
MGQFIYAVLDGLLELMILVIIINAIFSWLIVFNIVNVRHPVMRQVVYFLNAVTAPLLWPFQRIIPTFGGMDITPVIAILVLQAARSYLLPWLFVPIIRMLGG